MKILFTEDFKENLKDILKFIKQDSKNRADTQVRDLIFKGYVVVFVIDESEQTITIISIYKQNLPNLKYPQ